MRDLDEIARLLREHRHQQPVWERIVERVRDQHEREIIKIFGPEMRVLPSEEVVRRPTVILVFTNRSGSNLLCECLHTTGWFELAGEPLNWKNVARRAKRSGIRSFPEYCRREIGLIGNTDKSVIVKASIRQFIMLFRYGVIGPGGLFENTRYVHIERRDLLAQAVSYSIADQTRQFTSRKLSREADPVFDCEDIRKRLVLVSEQNALAKELFSTLGLDVFPVLYETMTARMNDTFSALFEFLGMSALEVKESEISLQKQRSQVNAAYIARFRRLMSDDFAQWCHPGQSKV